MVNQTSWFSYFFGTVGQKLGLQQFKENMFRIQIYMLLAQQPTNLSPKKNKSWVLLFNPHFLQPNQWRSTPENTVTISWVPSHGGIQTQVYHFFGRDFAGQIVP